MTTKNKLITLLILSAGAASSIAAINKIIKVTAVSKSLLSSNESLCYKWRFGNIHYTKSGSGKPLLLIHDLSAVSSGAEWNHMIASLEKNYTVYTIDLLGCGRSEKPNMTYTNYLFVQLISDFIKTVIGHRTNVIATGEAASIPIMACANNPDLFDQIMLVSPLSMLEYSQLPSKTSKLYKFMLDTPLAGTLLYNIATSKKTIREKLKTVYFANPYSVKENLINTCHEAANLGTSQKSVYSSVMSNYTKCNINNALKKIDNSLFLVGGACTENMDKILEEYKDYNPAIETALIPNVKRLPQLETPDALYELIHTFFC